MVSELTFLTGDIRIASRPMKDLIESAAIVYTGDTTVLIACTCYVSARQVRY